MDISPIILSVLEWGAVALAGYTVKKIHDVVTEIRRSYAAQTDQADAIGKLTKSVSDLSASLDAVHEELKEAKAARQAHDKLSDSSNVFEMRLYLVDEHDRLVAKGWASYDDRAQWHGSDPLHRCSYVRN